MQHNVCAAISKASAIIARTGVAKSGQYDGGGQRWKYRRIEDVMLAVVAAMAEVGLCTIPFVEEVVVTDGPNGWKTARVQVRYVIGASDGSTVEAKMPGEGQDKGDKAITKALTAAYKYLCLQLFCIPVEGLPENEHTVPDEPEPEPDLDAPAKPWTETERKRFFAALRETGVSYELLSKYLTRDGGESLSQRSELDRQNILHALKQNEKLRAAVLAFSEVSK